MHDSVMAWVGEVLTQADIRDRAVLEVGSYNVNGTVRPLVEALDPASYVGVDQTPGPGVDQVVDAPQLVEVFGADSFDVVLSTEMLEHAQDWRGCLRAMAEVLRPGGLLLLTTRSPGFKYHPFPDDHWRFTVPLMSKALTALGLGSHELRPDPDPASPGVLVKACKSDPWRPDLRALAELEAEAAPPKR
jgi:SAM-dependent methyltransferase